MADYINTPNRWRSVVAAANQLGFALEFKGVPLADWPLPNVWAGISAEDQRNLNTRLPDLHRAKAAVRFVSAEPLLGSLHFGALPGMMPDWVITGNESRGSRAGRLGTLQSDEHFYGACESIRDECKTAGVAYFQKQVPKAGKTIKDITQFPRSLQVREFPKAKAA